LGIELAPLQAPSARAAVVPRRYLRRHLLEPDYTRPLLELTAAQRRSLLEKLDFLYGRARAQACLPELERVMRVYYAHKTPEMIDDDRSFDPAERFTEKDVVLITYGDLITAPGRSPLQTLADFLGLFMRGSINTVHILPFFPYSSDRGFAIIDYEDVDPRLGSWHEIEELGRHFRLMFDGVFNHVSSKSRWFQRFLNGRPGYEDFFVAFTTRDAIDPDHLRLILRPRTSDLLSRFQTIHGPRFVWTTFGPDQMDLNFKNERVLLRVIETLLLYVRRGADLIRLDAVTYIWRELGTSCAHLEQSHVLVQLFRAILDVVAPQVALVTETNVPHADNVRYFGDGRNEAQMVYNFALPSLVLHAFHRGRADKLSRWAAGLDRPSDAATYFNFLDSHDGIGLLGARGILAPEEVDALVERTREHGGLVSYRDSGDGTRSPYELNITWYSALNRDDAGEDAALPVDRFIASRSIAFALMGVPGVYFPSVFGAKNDTAAVLAGSEARSINRKTIDEQALREMLWDRRSWGHRVAWKLRRLIKRRIACPAFHPNAAQRVLFGSDGVFALLRGGNAGRPRVLVLTNVTAAEQRVRFPQSDLGGASSLWRDLITARPVEARGADLDVTLHPYEVLWLEPDA
jgi:sucrose phosphorylase